MKKSQSMFAVLFALIAMPAMAEEFRLNDIDTNDCARAQHEVMLLNSPDVKVDAVCSPQGQYRATNGRVYKYRLYTTVTVPFAIQPGMQIKLGDIYTNDCNFAHSEIMILNTNRFGVAPVCYGPSVFASANGNTYDYKMTTMITVIK